MKFISSTAIVLIAGLAAAPAAAQFGQYGAPAQPTQLPRAVNQPAQAQPAPQAQEAPPKVTLSSKAAKAIIDLQTAVKANDTANIPAKLAAAQAVAQTKDDKYAIGVLQRQAAVAANDNNALAAAVETLANSGFLPQTKVAALYLDLGVHQFNAKQYAQAVASFQRANALNPNDPQAQEFLAQGLAASGQNAEAAAAYQRMFQASIAAGQKPSEDLYRHAVAAAYASKSPSAVELGRQWVAAYPTTDSWHNALAIYRNIDHPDETASFDILRLSAATGSLTGVADYFNYASAAANQANYGEARAIIAQGIAAGKIKPTDAGISDIEAALKGKNSPTPAELAAAEKSAVIPTAFLRVGDRYYGAGNYQKAAELYRQALAKGADSNLANLRLGEALVRSGDKAGAIAALNKVGGSEAEVAKFWLVYAQSHG